MFSQCDRAVITVDGPIVGLGVGVSTEVGPREVLVMTATEARQLGEQLRSAASAAAAGAREARRRERGDP